MCGILVSLRGVYQKRGDRFFPAPAPPPAPGFGGVRERDRERDRVRPPRLVSALRGGPPAPPRLRPCYAGSTCTNHVSARACHVSPVTCCGSHSSLRSQ